MPQLTSEPETAEQVQLSKLSVSIRGKLQFMDYLVRAALADAQRYQDESDPGTRIFIRQLVEMHAANLRLESQNMRVVGELCNALRIDGRLARQTRTPAETSNELVKKWGDTEVPGCTNSMCSPTMNRTKSTAAEPRADITSPELKRSLADIKGQAQFLLYLADQIEESLDQLATEADACHSAFLCKVLGMYSGQLESKHQGLGEKIAEACQEVYVTVREREMA